MEIKWNPYPETKPEKYGRYLITVEDAGTYVVSDEFSADRHEEWLDCFDGDVTAWAELPEPYEKPVKLKAYPINSAPLNKRIIIVNNNSCSLYSTILDQMTLDYIVKTEECMKWIPMPEIDFVEEE